MNRFVLTRRQLLVIAHDLLATAAAVIVSFYIRFELSGLESRLDGLVQILPGFLICAAGVFFVSRLHGAKWRFTSVPDLRNIVRAATVLAILLLVLDYVLVSPSFYGSYFFGKTTILLYWFLQIAFLAGTRIAYRHFRHVRTQYHAREGNAVPCLVLGRAADTEVLLRAIESGAASQVRLVGILSPSFADRGQSIRGVPVVGNLEDLEQTVKDASDRGIRVARLIFTASALVPE